MKENVRICGECKNLVTWASALGGLTIYCRWTYERLFADHAACELLFVPKVEIKPEEVA